MTRAKSESIYNSDIIRQTFSVLRSNYNNGENFYRMIKEDGEKRVCENNSSKSHR